MRINPKKTLVFCWLLSLCLFACKESVDRPANEILPCAKWLAYQNDTISPNCILPDQLPASIQSIATIINSINELNYGEHEANLNQAIDSLETLPNTPYPLLLAKAYRFRSGIVFDEGDFYGSLDFLKKEEVILQKLNQFTYCDSLELAGFHSWIGMTYEKLQQVEEALLHGQKALSLYEGLRDTKNISTALNNLITTNGLKGNVEQAYLLAEQALCLYENLPKDKKEFNLDNAIRNNLAGIYQKEGIFCLERGQKSQALSNFKKANQLLYEVQDSLYNQFNAVPDSLKKILLGHYLEGIIISTANIGSNFNATEEGIESADSFLVTMEKTSDFIIEHLGQIPPPIKSLLFNSKGFALSKKGAFEEALQVIDDAIQSGTLNNRYPTNIDLLDKSVIRHEMGLVKSISIKGKILESYYSATSNIDQLEKAVTSYQHMVLLIEKMLKGFGSDDSVELIRQFLQIYYAEASIAASKLFKRTGKQAHFEQALEISEKGKNLTLSQANIRNTQQTAFTDGRKELLVKDIEYRNKIRSLKQNYLNTLRGGQAATANEIQTQLIQVQTYYNNFLKQLENSDNPAERNYYFSRYNQEIPKLSIIQKEWLDKETAVVEYELGVDEGVAFVITQDTFATFSISTDSSLFNLIGKYEASLSLSGFQSGYPTYAHRLYQILLQKAATILNKKSKLIIIPDKEISNIPFVSLLTKAPSSEDTSYHQYDFLLHQFDYIAYLPSFGSLQAFLQLAKVNDQAKAPLGIFVATPGTNNYLSPKHACSGDTLTVISAATTSIRNIYFPTTPIYSTEAAFKKEANKYNILQLSMHGCLVNKKDDLSNFLQFSASETEDGHLTVGEIYALSLQAELAILTNCDTGKGVFDAAEGLKGVSWAFMYAGCQGTIATMQKVRDKDAGKLLALFYKFLIEDKLSAPAALAKSQKVFLNNPSNGNGYPSNWANYNYSGIAALSPL